MLHEEAPSKALLIGTRLVTGTMQMDGGVDGDSTVYEYGKKRETNLDTSSPCPRRSPDTPDRHSKSSCRELGTGLGNPFQADLQVRIEKVASS